MKQLAGDPFGERLRPRCRAELHVLGGAFTVESSDAALLRLARVAFDGLPRHRLTPKPRQFRVRLVATDGQASWSGDAEPPRPKLTGGEGLLCASIDADNFAVVDAAMSRALVCASRGLLQHPYHARYELIELAVVTLASRAQSLVPLHAACVGRDGRGLLLIGASGAGKSTLALHALIGGLELVSEDSAFVDLRSSRVTGVPNFLHIAPGGLGWVPDGRLARQIRRSPVIRRRSGAQKHEVDLRKMPGRIAAAPVRLAATVLLSPRSSGRRTDPEPVAPALLLQRLRREQPYAARLPGWREFEERAVALPAYELRRARHPDVAVARLRELLEERVP